MIFLDGILFLTALGFIGEGLSKYVETESVEKHSNGWAGNLQSVCKKLKLAFHVGIIVLFEGSGALVFFGSWDFLIREFAYLNVFMRVVGIILFTALYLTISGSSVVRVDCALKTKMPRSHNLSIGSLLNHRIISSATRSTSSVIPDQPSPSSDSFTQ